jgi:hypothetical protein
MITLFAHALDHKLRGTATYLGTVQSLFSQDESCGLVEIQGDGGARAFVLYAEGKSFAAYCIAGDKAHPYDPDELIASLPPEEMDIRYLNLPEHAVRAAWQALQWYPPLRGAQIEASTLGRYMDALKLENTAGLLNLTLPDRDGFLFLQDGNPVSAEAIFASARGFDEVLPDLHGGREALRGTCSVWLYDLVPGTPTAELIKLRLALCGWVLGIINGYLMLVGSSLVSPLNYEINTMMRNRHWNIRLVGAALIDNHLFMDATLATQAYHAILTALTGHISKVIGEGLAQRTLDGAFRRLQEDRRHSLEAHTLLPAEFMTI